MSKKVCGNCEHFSHEPNTPSRGVCWYSAEFDYYVVRGEKWAGCRDWEPKRESNWQRYFGTPEKAAEMLGKVASCGRDCPLFLVCPYEKKCEDVWLEWLGGDAE